MAIEGKKGVAGGRSLAKDLQRLVRGIDRLSDGQARLVAWDEADLSRGITVAIAPDSGLYKDGEFLFKIACNSRYPERAPDVHCRTLIYHPNIDIGGEGAVCLNLLDDDFWTEAMGLAEVVLGLLFLLHNPNLDDPLCVVIRPGMDGEEFAQNVARSLDGETVEGFPFQRNRGRGRERGAAPGGVSGGADATPGEMEKEEEGAAVSDLQAEPDGRACQGGAAAAAPGETGAMSRGAEAGKRKREEAEVRGGERVVQGMG